MTRTARIIYALDDAGNETSEVLATTHPASQESIFTVLAASDSGNDDNGRSPWLWFRLQNGDLILGVFPQGETYFACEVDAETPRELMAPDGDSKAGIARTVATLAAQGKEF